MFFFLQICMPLFSPQKVRKAPMRETNTTPFSINVKMTRQSKRWRSPWKLWRWQKSSCASWFRFQFCATKTYQIFFTKLCASFCSFWLAVDDDKCDVEEDDDDHKDDQDHDDCNVAVDGDEGIENIETRSRKYRRYWNEVKKRRNANAIKRKMILLQCRTTQDEIVLIFSNDGQDDGDGAGDHWP